MVTCHPATNDPVAHHCAPNPDARFSRQLWAQHLRDKHGDAIHNVADFDEYASLKISLELAATRIPNDGLHVSVNWSPPLHPISQSLTIGGGNHPAHWICALADLQPPLTAWIDHCPQEAHGIVRLPCNPQNRNERRAARQRLYGTFLRSGACFRRQ